MAKKPNSPNTKAAPAKPGNAKPAAPAPAKQAVKNAPVKQAPSLRNWFTVPYMCLWLSILLFLLYANTLGNGYVLDDTMVIKENVYVHQGISGIPELLATPHMRGYMVIPNDLYRPLSLVVLAIEYQFFGLNPAWGHFFNILTFAGCVVLLFLFLNKFFGGQKTVLAFIGAAIFAVHPIHTEVVANIKSLDELLCYLLAFLSLNLFMNYMQKGNMIQLLLGTFVFFLSCLSKETAVTLLAIIPLVFFFYRNDSNKRAAMITGGAVVATGLFLLIRQVILAKYNANQPSDIDFIDNALSHAPSAASRIATEFFIMGKYLLLMFVPYPLLSNYSFKSIPFMGFTDIGVLLSIAVYGFLVYYVITRFLKDKKDPFVFAILFFFATISLFSNFPFLMGAEMAERFTFFASTGVCIAAAAAIEKWVLKADAVNVMSFMSSKVLMIMAPVILLFGGMTIVRNMDWKSEYTLYKSDLGKSPNDTRLYQYLATAIAENEYPNEPDSNRRKAMDQESIGYLKHALEIYPEFAEAHVELGRLYERSRMYNAAVVEDTVALRLKPFNATANNNLGSVYITLGKYREAIPYLQRSVDVNPNFKFVYLNLARCLRQLQVFDSAAMYYKRMLALDPNYLDGIKELAAVYFMKQKYDSAAIYFKQVTDMTPGDPDAFNNVGAVYLNSKKYELAIEQFRKAIAINANYVIAYSNMGKAYFMLGKYGEAIDIIKKGMAVNPKYTSDIQNIAISYQKMGDMNNAKQYEAMAQRVNPAFKLPAQ